jgi:hypothetical protein
MRSGATITVGYLFAVVGGSFVFSYQALGATLGPDLIGVIALAGLAFPLVFGSLGGAIAALID